ncbi:hypothetical protein AOQ84DRAFT_224584 [Glonium stellatum]|uniref:Uncharacterized protein n=1 Tax=Glonium stellatum TaxID=574774 RepID=A0A8E2EVM4_9PEZI|nr:hypothetical protein AOQ84DRAFT_224584 [Glonium stellatum]
MLHYIYTFSFPKHLITATVFILTYHTQFTDAIGSQVDATSNSDPPSSPSANSDLYGTGVRVGLYLQGFGLLLNMLRNLEDSGRGIMLACGGIALSIMVSWTILVSQKAISACEAYLVLALTFCAITSATPSLRQLEILIREGVGLTVLILASCWVGTAAIAFYSRLCLTLPLLETKNTVWFFTEVSLTG